MNQLKEALLVGFDLPQIIAAFLDGGAERLAAIQNQTTRMEETIRWFGQWLPQAGDAELIAYIDCVKLYGEPAAIQWLRGQRP